MKWLQFFTPVSSINWVEAHKLLEQYPKGDVVFLDVRQPNEYQNGHLPGAKLLPVGDLGERIDELNKAKPLVIYCATGGRSRVAAQLLAGKGFEKVYNLTGGIKAWEKEVAVGPEDSGMFLFVSEATPEQAVITGFGLEVGLRDFYVTMQSKVTTEKAKTLFAQLAEIEILHQKQLIEIYMTITGESTTLEDFNQKIVQPAMEGGLTTQEYLNRYNIDQESEVEILSLAMAIEVQALDLYMRAADNSGLEATKKTLLKIADEERNHITKLGQHIDQLTESA
ncbi:rhodanese-like domain-containing protein [Desulforhopalus sp. 52FAK]